MISEHSSSESRGGPSVGIRQPKQERSRETVERILHAADQEIGAVGLKRATTTSIARRAGVSVGGLYRFFRDKEELARALAARYLAEVSGEYSRVMREMRDAADVERAVVDLVDVAARAHLKNPGYYRLTEDSGPELDESPAHVVREKLVSLFVARLREGLSDEPEAVLRQVVTLCVETVRHTLAHAPHDDEQARDRLVGEVKTMLGAYMARRFSEPAGA